MNEVVVAHKKRTDDLPSSADRARGGHDDARYLQLIGVLTANL